MKPIRDIRVRKIESPSPGKKALKIISLILGLVVVWILAMNVIVNYVLPLKTTTIHSTQGGLYYELGIGKTHYRQGEPIHLRLIVRNTSIRVVILRFSSTERYNFVVKRDIDFVLFHFPIDVWQSSYHVIPHQIVNTLTLKPGETKVFEDTWNQKDAKGNQVPSGRYLIAAYLTNVGSKTILELPARMQK